MEKENNWPTEERKMRKKLDMENIFPEEEKTKQQKKEENIWRGRILVSEGEKRRRNIFGDGKNNDRQMDRISYCSKSFFLQTSFICFLKIPAKVSSLKLVNVALNRMSFNTHY